MKPRASRTETIVSLVCASASIFPYSGRLFSQAILQCALSCVCICVCVFAHLDASHP